MKRVQKNKELIFINQEFQKKSGAFKFYINPLFWEYWLFEEIKIFISENKKEVDENEKFNQVLNISKVMCNLGLEQRQIIICLKALSLRVLQNVSLL